MNELQSSLNLFSFFFFLPFINGLSYQVLCTGHYVHQLGSVCEMKIEMLMTLSKLDH